MSVLSLQGLIVSRGGPGWAGPTISLQASREMIDRAFKPARLQAVVLNINSPGGSPVQSDLVASYIRGKAEQRNVPVIAFVEDMAVSGGYWLACAGDRIYAARSSVVGSIGVINQGLGFHQLIEKVGIERRTITAGENKSKLDPFAPLQQKDVQLMEGLLREVHQHFMDQVRASRGKRLVGGDDVLFNGDFWTGEPAVKLGLIDGIDTAEAFIQREWAGQVELVRVKARAGLAAKLSSMLDRTRPLVGAAQEEGALRLSPMTLDPRIAEIVHRFLR